MKLFGTILILILRYPSAWATDVVWIQFQVNHSYSDSTISCVSSRRGNPLFFAAEVDNGKILRAAFHTTPNPGRSLFVNLDEHPGIELFTDSQGRYWLKKLSLNGRLLKWALYSASHGIPIICGLPQPLQSVSPAEVTYEFDPNEIEEFQFGYSKKSSVTGLRVDGKAYQAKLQLIQREFQYSR